MVDTPWDRIIKAGIEKPTICDIPWEERGIASYLKVTNFPGIGYVGEGELKINDFCVPEYSWGHFIQNKVSPSSTPHPVGEKEKDFILRPDQQEDVKLIKEVYDDGGKEFLIANKTGTGKTVTAISALHALQPSSVLVVCPAAVIPVWRKHFRDMGDKGINIVIINYESLKKLFSPPPQAINAKKTATQNKYYALYGKPYCQFDVVVFDETHKLKNPISQQSRFARTISHNSFVLRLSATPGKDPSQLHYLFNGLSYASGDTIKVEDTEKGFDDYIKWCRRQGITGIVPAPFGNGITWEGKRKDLEIMEKLIFSPTPHNTTWASRRKGNNLPTIREPLEVELSTEEKKNYDKVVEDVRKELLNIKNSGRKDTSKGLAALMSLRQKTGMLKASIIANYAQYCIEDLDEQVVIAAVFSKTSEVLSTLLEEKGISSTIIDGSLTIEEKEKRRLAFQRGEYKVVIVTVTEGISLHACEDEDTTSNDRRLIIADIQFSPSQHLQVEGRINRNGQRGVVTIPYLSGTIDDKVVSTVVKGVSSQAIIQADKDSEDSIAFFARTIGVEL